MRLLQKAVAARQARVAAQTPEGLTPCGGGLSNSQSSGIVSEVGR